MPETSARLLLLLSLLQSRPEWSSDVLAARLEVSRRTVRRDVDRLRRLGYPVHVTKGPGSAYRLEAGTRLPPLQFDDEQAIAIAVALQTASSTVAGLREAAARALATIGQVLPTRLRHRLDAMPVTSIRNSWDLAAPEVDVHVLVAIGTAIRQREVLSFEYADDRYRVEPHHLVMWTGRWYLVAWDLGTADWRVFRVDRAAPKGPSGTRFTRRTVPGGDVASFLVQHLDRGDTPEQWPCRGQVLLDLPATVVARWAPGGAVVEQVAPSRCRLTLGAWSWAGLAGLVGTFGADFEVVGPEELATTCTELSKRYATAVRLSDPLSDPATSAGRA